jgi:hypothetical protein
LLWYRAERSRRFYGEAASAFVLGRHAPYTERLLFDPASRAADPDGWIIANGMANQATEKTKDLPGAGDPPN